MTENEISNTIIGAVMKVHKALCPGLLGSAYQECLLYVLLKEGLIIEKQKPMQLVFEEIHLECGYRID